MGCDLDQNSNSTEKEGLNAKTGCISLHSFSNLSNISPAVFMYLLKECYIYGTHRATPKFRILQHETLRALQNNPNPGPFTFIAKCLYIIPLLGPVYREGFSHMIISTLRHFKNIERYDQEFQESKKVAGRLLVDILDKKVVHEERILIKILETYEIGLTDVAQGTDTSTTEVQIRNFISEFLSQNSFMTAVTLLQQFNLKIHDESLLETLINKSAFEPAEKLAGFMGRPLVCSLITRYLEMKMVKKANELVKRYEMEKEFGYVGRAYKESLLKKFAEKGCWDVAEMRAKKDKKLLEYLVYLALEAGYTEKVDELCERYSLEGFVNSLVPEEIISGEDFLSLRKLSMDINEIVFVDDINTLLEATNYIENCKIIGLDCEWKPNYEKGAKPSKVSIMQIASERKAFIFDLIKLYKEESEMLDLCFRRILSSSNVLKLGYNLQCDLYQLSHSYGDLECFRSYEMLLDIQKLFKQTIGGLAGLSKEVLGAGLNKTRRNSNWEQRPLSLQQKEYAALDAAVLVHIFHHVRAQPKFTKVEWKSHILNYSSSDGKSLEDLHL